MSFKLIGLENVHQRPNKVREDTKKLVECLSNIKVGEFEPTFYFRRITIWFYHRSFALRLSTWSCKIWRDTRVKVLAPTWRNKRTCGIIIPVATSTIQRTIMVKRNFGFKIKHRYYCCFTRRKVQIRLDTCCRSNRCQPEQRSSNTMKRYQRNFINAYPFNSSVR